MIELSLFLQKNRLEAGCDEAGRGCLAGPVVAAAVILDQNNDTIPERPICEELGIELLDGLGRKIQSSSWLLNK